MIKKAIFTSLISMFFLSGCSSLKARFFGASSPSTENTKTFNYNFTTPRRATLDTKASSRLTEMLNSKKSNANTYYSASGFACRNLSLSDNRSACLVGGQWKMAAPILGSSVNATAR